MTEKCLIAVNRIACATRARRTRPGLVTRAAPRGYADHLGTDAPRKPRRTPTPTPHTHSPVTGALFGIADLTGFSGKKFRPHLVSLIKVEGLFSPYIVVIFDIVNSESLVQRYIYI